MESLLTSMVSVDDAIMEMLVEGLENLSSTVTNTQPHYLVEVAQSIAYLSTSGLDEDGVRTVVAPGGTSIVTSGAETDVFG